jgi:uncharacterized membrane protein YccF (DUF307 family)
MRKIMNEVSGGGAPVVVRDRPGCLLQLLWFVFVGWWLGLFAVVFAYFMFALVITIPLGVLVLNNLPELIALRPAPRLITPYGSVEVQQYNILLRAIWFVLVGWWLTALVLALGYVLCLTIIGMPLGFVLFDIAPAALTLRRTV